MKNKKYKSSEFCSAGDWAMFNYKGIFELNQEVESLKIKLCVSSPVECVMEKGIEYIVNKIVDARAIPKGVQ